MAQLFCQAARDKYLVHPLHEEFVAAHKKKLQDLCVFDYLAAISESSQSWLSYAQLLWTGMETYGDPEVAHNQGPF